MWPREFVRTAAEFDLAKLAELDQGRMAVSSPSNTRPRYRVTYSAASKIVWSVERIMD